MIASEFPGGELTAFGERLLDGRKVYPCSQAQARFWFEEHLDPRNPARNVFARWRLVGDISGLHMDDAWRTIVARHGSLRTCFSAIEGVPVQLVEPDVAFRVREVDYTLLSESESAVQAEQLAAIEARAPFDLRVAPLIRVSLIRLRDRESILMVTAHHIVCDGWSMGILATEMGELNDALQMKRMPNLLELGLGYGDYSIRERQRLSTQTFDKERELLRAQLSACGRFELEPDKPRPRVQTSSGEISSLLLESDLTGKLAGIARENGCTLFVASYAALLVLLHRASGKTDIAISTQVTGRDEVDIERTVGTFVNTIPLRADLHDDPTFVQVIERACDVVSDAFELRHVPAEALVEIVNPTRDPSRSSLFSVNFIFQRSFVKNASYGRFRLIDLPSRSAGAIYDLCFFMVERPEGWRISCEYNVDLFEARTIDGLIARFADIVRAVVADPRRRISELEASGTRVDGASSLAIVRKLVSNLVGHDRFDLRDDIFARGFDSLLAARLVAQIKAWNGVELPLRSLFEDRNVADIARRVDGLERATVVAQSDVKPFVTYNARGTRRPFIFLHSDLFAEGIYCKKLASAMPDHPIHAVAPHGTAGLPLLPTIEAMALDYLSRIRALQPTGPYRIGGFCASGLVAFEFARLLHEAGEVVERLVLVNASALPTRTIPSFDRLLRWIGLDERVDPARRTTLCYNLARMHAAIALGPITIFRLLYERVSLALSRDKAGSRTDDEEPFEGRRGARNIENSLGHLVAAFTYHPKKFAGDVTLIWGKGQPTDWEVPALAWKSVARNVRTLSVFGGHIGLLNAHVEDLARALDAALDG